MAGAAVGGALILAGGCTTLGPDFKRPEAAVPEQWSPTKASEIKVQEGADYRSWWELFRDPVLDRLIDAAYKQNLTLQGAGVSIAEARAQLGIAVGQQYPQLQAASGSFTRNKISKNSANFSPGADRTFWNQQIGFDAAWELDFWGRFRRGVESAEASLISTVASYDDALVSLTAEVARVYVVIRTFEERIKLARENIVIQQRGLEIARVRFENGAVTELDVTQATSLLRDTEASVPQFQIGLRQAENAMAVLLGKPPGSIQDMLAAPGAIPKAPPEVAIGIPAELLRRRPDVRQAELQAAAQSALIGVAEADLYPSLALTGSIGLISADTRNNGLGDLFKTDSLNYFVGPSFNWPILNYGRLKNNVRVQDARLQGLLINYQDTVLSAAQEVEDGLVGFLRSQDQVRFLSDSVKASERSVNLANVQYRDGAVDYQRVLDTQRALVSAQDSWTVARGNIALNLVATYKALGGGWEQRVGNEVVDGHYVDAMRKRTDWGNLLPPRNEPEALEPPPPAEDLPLFGSPDW
jgi:NodT family efflux transporter outer membrane factor (OMF) lipoprotein